MRILVYFLLFFLLLPRQPYVGTVAVAAVFVVGTATAAVAFAVVAIINWLRSWFPHEIPFHHQRDTVITAGIHLITIILFWEPDSFAFAWTFTPMLTMRNKMEIESRSRTLRIQTSLQRPFYKSLLLCIKTNDDNNNETLKITMTKIRFAIFAINTISSSFHLFKLMPMKIKAQKFTRKSNINKNLTELAYEIWTGMRMKMRTGEKMAEGKNQLAYTGAHASNSKAKIIRKSHWNESSVENSNWENR